MPPLMDADDDFSDEDDQLEDEDIDADVGGLHALASASASTPPSLLDPAMAIATAAAGALKGAAGGVRSAKAGTRRTSLPSGLVASIPDNKRKKLEAEKVVVLKEFYDRNPKPTADEVRTLAMKIEVEEGKVKNWFTNQRFKEKKSGGKPATPAATRGGGSITPPSAAAAARPAAGAAPARTAPAGFAGAQASQTGAHARSESDSVPKPAPQPHTRGYAPNAATAGLIQQAAAQILQINGKSQPSQQHLPTPTRHAHPPLPQFPPGTVAEVPPGMPPGGGYVLFMPTGPHAHSLVFQTPTPAGARAAQQLPGARPVSASGVPALPHPAAQASKPSAAYDTPRAPSPPSSHPATPTGGFAGRSSAAPTPNTFPKPAPTTRNKRFNPIEVSQGDLDEIDQYPVDQLPPEAVPNVRFLLDSPFFQPDVAEALGITIGEVNLAGGGGGASGEKEAEKGAAPDGARRKGGQDSPGADDDEMDVDGDGDEDGDGDDEGDAPHPESMQASPQKTQAPLQQPNGSSTLPQAGTKIPTAPQPASYLQVPQASRRSSNQSADGVSVLPPTGPTTGTSVTPTSSGASSDSESAALPMDTAAHPAQGEKQVLAAPPESPQQRSRSASGSSSGSGSSSTSGSSTGTSSSGGSGTAEESENENENEAMDEAVVADEEIANMMDDDEEEEEDEDDDDENSARSARTMGVMYHHR
ncbi:hypothetical protein HDU96_010058 [Phlyctochytrium bullatum]|nr:hypothetical protein HDU96_010058 [Phlyctochytrium bullatum]